MDLRHLRCAVVVANELDYSRAAARLNISRPSLSRQIRHLEEELGVQLFRRTRGKISLTESGAQFIREAEDIICKVGHAASVARAGQIEIGHLTIGTITSADSSFKRLFVNIVQKFSKKYPDIRVSLRTMQVSAQIAALLDGTMAVGFVTLPIDHAQLAVEKVMAEPLMIAMPLGHHLAGRTRMPLRAIANELLILFPRSLCPGYYDQILSWCREAGFAPRIAPEADGIDTLLTLVTSGRGLALLPESAGRNIDAIAFRKITPPVPQLEMGVAFCSTSQSTLVKDFVKIAKETAKTGNAGLKQWN